jgi:endonuclease/exonuclease/phosphatase family metal-dependent hydrolase
MNDRVNSSLRLITWNILHGKDEGPKQNDWPRRRIALRQILSRARPDLLCLQEALRNQVLFVGDAFPEHGLAWAGRDDGHEAGEACAIFFNAQRFRRLAGGTFWLNDATDKPARAWDDKFPRICTWVRLAETTDDRTFLLFNTHFPLRPISLPKAGEVLAQKIEQMRNAEALLAVGDFNCAPDAEPRKRVLAVGLQDAEWVNGSLGAPTYHGQDGLLPIDAVMHSPEFRVLSHRLLTEVPDGVFPSDHYGLLVELIREA